MKKLVFLAAALIMLAQVCIAQNPASTGATASASGAVAAADVAIAEVDNLVFDFGKLKQGVPATHEFTFTNKGKVPMIITNAQPSCGCTVPAWTREPIPPGGQGFVKATFNAAAPGVFDKSVTVTANVEAGVIYLRIRGEVLPNN